MTKKGSRKPAYLRKCENIMLYVTPGEKMFIREMAEENGVSMNEYIVLACFALAGRDPDSVRIKLAEEIYKKNNELNDILGEKVVIEDVEPEEEEESKNGRMGL